MSVPMSSGTPFAMSARILAGSLMGALLFMGVALFYVLPTDGTPPLWIFLAQVVAGIAIHFFLEAIGYRVQALDPSMSDDDAAAAARVRWQSGMILRFALCEVVALASIAAAFVLEEGGFLVYAVGALVSLVLMIVHVWPWSRPVGKTAEGLESAGQPSHLREAFGLSAPGPIQRL